MASDFSVLKMRLLLRKLILGALTNGFALWVVSEIFPNRFDVFSNPVWVGFIAIGIAIGIANTFIKPVLKTLSLPFVILTMGLFLIVINAVVLWLVEWIFAEILVSTGVQLIIHGGFMSYILIGFTLGVINTLLHWVMKEKRV